MNMAALKALHEAAPEPLAKQRVQFARLKVAWEVGARALKEVDAAKPRTAAAVAKEAADLELPLDVVDVSDMEDAWKKRYGIVIEHHLFPGPSLENRVWREFRRWALSVTEITKMRSALLEQTPKDAERTAITDSLDIASKQLPCYKPTDVVGYYWGLRVLANCWARCGNYEVPSKKKEGSMVLMCPLDTALNYADRAIRVVMATGMPWHEQLGWLEQKDRVTRSIAAGMVRLHWPLGEALTQALAECTGDWSFVKASSIVGEHQSITELDTGLHYSAQGQDNQREPAPRSKGGKKGGAKGRFASGAAKVVSKIGKWPRSAPRISASCAAYSIR